MRYKQLLAGRRGRHSNSQVFHAGNNPLPYPPFPEAQLSLSHFKHYNIRNSCPVFSWTRFSSYKQRGVYRNRTLGLRSPSLPVPRNLLRQTAVFPHDLYSMISGATWAVRFFPSSSGNTVVQPQLRTSGLELAKTKENVLAECDDRDLSAPLKCQDKHFGKPQRLLF